MIKNLISGWFGGWVSWLVVAVAVLGIVAAAVHSFNNWTDGIEQRGYDRAQAEYTAKALKATAENRETEQKLNRQIATLEAKDYEQTKDQLRAAGAARDELIRLRNQLSKPAASRGAASTDTAATSQGNGAATVEEVLGQCAGEFTALAEVADDIAGKLRTLQGYVRMACVPSMAELEPHIVQPTMQGVSP